MTSQWQWQCVDADGAVVPGGPAQSAIFPTQGEAEAWLGESWEELADAGVAATTLLHDGTPVYGPMPLDPA